MTDEFDDLVEPPRPEYEPLRVTEYLAATLKKGQQIEVVEGPFQGWAGHIMTLLIDGMVVVKPILRPVVTLSRHLTEPESNKMDHKTFSISKGTACVCVMRNDGSSAIIFEIDPITEAV